MPLPLPDHPPTGGGTAAPRTPAGGRAAAFRTHDSFLIQRQNRFWPGTLPPFISNSPGTWKVECPNRPGMELYRQSLLRSIRNETN